MKSLVKHNMLIGRVQDTGQRGVEQNEISKQNQFLNNPVIGLYDKWKKSGTEVKLDTTCKYNASK